MPLWRECCRSDAAFSASRRVGCDLSSPQRWWCSRLRVRFTGVSPLYSVLLASAARHHQAAVSIHLPLSLGPPSPPASRSSLSPVPCLMQQLPTSHQFYTSHMPVFRFFDAVSLAPQEWFSPLSSVSCRHRWNHVNPSFLIKLSIESFIYLYQKGLVSFLFYSLLHIMLLLWLFCPLSSHTNNLYKEVFSHISGHGGPCLSKPCASCLHGIWLLFENLLPKCLQLWLAYEATVVVRWNSVLMDHSTVSPCFTPAATPTHHIDTCVVCSNIQNYNSNSMQISSSGEIAKLAESWGLLKLLKVT